MLLKQNFLIKEAIFMISAFLSICFLIGGFATGNPVMFLASGLFAIAAKIS